MATYSEFNPLLEDNFQELTVPSLVRVETIAAARLQGRSVGTNNIGMLYIAETEGLYQYCTDCDNPDDDDLVLTTADGGTTRWEMTQKVSRKLSSKFKEL